MHLAIIDLRRTLMENPGHAFTRGELIQKALGYSYEGLERRVDSHFKNLRKKGVATVAVLVDWPVVTTALVAGMLLY